MICIYFAYVYFMSYTPRICNVCYFILHESVPFFLCREPSLWSFTLLNKYAKGVPLKSMFYIDSDFNLESSHAKQWAKIHFLVLVIGIISTRGKNRLLRPLALCSALTSIWTWKTFSSFEVIPKLNKMVMLTCKHGVKTEAWTHFTGILCTNTLVFRKILPIADTTCKY